MIVLYFELPHTAHRGGIQYRVLAQDGIRHFILVAPWGGISDFEVDGSSVHIVDPTANSLRGGS